MRALSTKLRNELNYYFLFLLDNDREKGSGRSLPSVITIIPRPTSPFNSLNSLFPPQYFPFPSLPSSIRPFICISVRGSCAIQPSSFAGDRNWLSRGKIGRNEAPNPIQLLFKHILDSRLWFPFVSFRDLIKFLCLKKFGMDGIYIRDRDLLVERSSGWWPFDSKLRNSRFSTVMENFS